MKIVKRLTCFAFLISALTLTACSKPFPEAGIVEFLWPVLLPPDSRKFIFVTGTGTTGNTGGISGADTICQNAKTNDQPNLPGLATDYKAMLVDGTNRTSCAAANCSTGPDSTWVLAANTTYYRPDEVAIGTTTSNAVFTFPLDAAFSTTAGLNWWTGLNANWTVALDVCDGGAVPGWDDGTAFFDGTMGATNDTANTSIAPGFPDSCDTVNHLLCVRQ